ncbi:MAG: hypothetical protein IJ035_01435 [Oscillospiraceae bacterium]|nr:hypothetical protein [Oscillospiraceae bacterium]
MNSKISKILGFVTAFVMVAAAAVSSGSSSYAETFATEKGITFVELAPIEITSQPSDVSGTTGDTATSHTSGNRTQALAGQTSTQVSVEARHSASA